MSLFYAAFGSHPHDSWVKGKEGLFVEFVHSNCELLMASTPNGPSSGEQTTTTDEDVDITYYGRKGSLKRNGPFSDWVCSFSHSNSLLICDGQCSDVQGAAQPTWIRSLGWCSGIWLKEEQRVVGHLTQCWEEENTKHNRPGQGNWGKGCYGLNIYVFLEFICVIHPLGLWN